ncbi:hypothetical protein FNV43_RR27026 [Rhamnella rubrinervis]|uniref:Uncharacterized protein n=1 Tax=Rhamnella rubrinervis TaxID=2594499 RepID=A0A8K0DJM4_9ROSA|nr:hypothetical protein FNV43_RR27026 [Rhamnella rubrinervis]
MVALDLITFDYAGQYEPELFPGAKVRDETYTAFENIYPVLTEFRKNQQWHRLLDKLLNKRRKEAEDRARAAEEKNNELTKQIEELRAQQDRMEESLLQYEKITSIRYAHPRDRLEVSSCDWTLDMNDDTVANYVKGVPLLLSHNWRDVDYVYVLVNNENKHRYAAEVDLVNQHVMIYDNSCNAT